MIAGNAHRVGQLIEIIVKSENKSESLNPRVGDINDGYQSSNNGLASKALSEFDEHLIVSPEICFKTTSLSIMTPNRSRTLIRNLNFEFESTNNVLITGEIANPV